MTPPPQLTVMMCFFFFIQSLNGEAGKNMRGVRIRGEKRASPSRRKLIFRMKTVFFFDFLKRILSTYISEFNGPTKKSKFPN
jgi:hypothetical protein